MQSLLLNNGYKKVLIDCTKTNNYSADVKAALVEHEFGHTFGLSHQPSLKGSSIMYNYDDRTLSRPGAIDCQNINHIYG